MTLRKEIEGAMARGYCYDRNSHKEVDAHLIMDMSENVCQLVKERLEKIADDCPNCDNSGFTVVQTSERRYVTRDMASDACDMSLEGTLYSDDEFEQEQCQWCYETKNSRFNINTLITELSGERE